MSRDVMKSWIAILLAVFALANSEDQGIAQQATSPASSSGQQAVSVVLKHYILNSLALNPTTGQALPKDGAWSIAHTTPQSCPQSTQSCVEVVYTVAAASVQCSWVVLLNSDGNDGSILDENSDAERYLLRKLSPIEAKPLVQSRTKPIYPAIAMAAHISGPVVMDAVIDESGRIQRIGVVSGPAMLRAAALDAARTWMFTPATVNGKAIPFNLQLKFDFHTNGPPNGAVELTP